MQKPQHISQSINKISRFIKITVSIIFMINLSIISIIIENLLIVIIAIVIALGVYKNIQDINKKNVKKAYHTNHKIINNRNQPLFKTNKPLTKEEKAIQEYEKYPSW